MLLLLLLGVAATPSFANSVALGNLAVVIKGEGLISTDETPIRAKTADLWCQASVDKENAELMWGRFVRMGQSHKVLEATLDEDLKKARLVLGDAAVTDAGKYRCEMKVKETGELVYGNMFVYSRPVMHTNGSLELKQSESDPTLVEAGTTKAVSGTTAELTCPVVGYPNPNIIWFKDGLPLEESDRVSFVKTSVFINEVSEEDTGRYRCVATNQFAVVVDGEEQDFEIKMDQQLDLASNHAWVFPLMVILIIFLLVFIIIYGCAAYRKYQSQQYNVARREQNMRQEEEQRLTKNNV